VNALINKKVKFQDLGTKDYQPSWDYQEQLLKQNLDIKVHNRENPDDLRKTDNHLLFVEHPHVYTLGKSGHESNLLANENKLKEINATYVKVNRGGDITYHGYGQIVGYPVLDLENFYTDIHRYMRDLEEVIILTLAEFGLHGERSPGETGVWFDVGKPYARKICALGVKASRWITIHGFALNVNTDMRYFDYIIPCGITDKQVTSMKRELETEVDFEEVKDKIKKHFQEVFDCELI
jgi:lipoyl(octanoyl) transferase